MLEMNEQGLSAASLFPTSQTNELTAGFQKALRRHAPLLEGAARRGRCAAVTAT